MPLAAKHFDVVLGVDVHIVILITPAGPVPTPAPIPFTGLVFSPWDYLPRIGVNVLVNGLPRATAGSAVVAMPMHIPIGGPFLKPPANSGELFMGSMSVASGGEPVAYGLLPALTCQDIGLPAPARAKKQIGIPSLLLPTSIVIPIPASQNVIVGGFPTVSLPALEKLAWARSESVLKAPLKQLKPVKYVNRKLRRGTRYLKAYADRGLKVLGLAKWTLLRNEVHRAICWVTGHPVDIATGKVFTDFTDLTLAGPLPFPLERVWYSTSTYDGPLGHGWHASFDVALAADAHVVAVRLSDGRAALFPALREGATHFDDSERTTLSRDAQGYCLVEADTGFIRRFERVPGRRELPMTSLEDRNGFGLRFAYDAQGRLGQILDSGGRTWRFHHQGTTQRIEAIEGPHPSDAGRTIIHHRFRYDARGDLVESRDALANAQRFLYRDHLLVQETRASGLSFYFAWEGEGAAARCVRTWGDGGIHDHKLTYDLDRMTTVVRSSLGFETTYTHDGAMVLRVVDALGSTRCTAYDAGYRPVTELDPLGQQSRRVYDARGNLTTSQLPDGAAISVTYGADDLPREAVDPVGGRWAWSRDARGRVTTETDPLDRTTRYVYDGPWLVGLLDPSGARTSYAYDHEGNLAAVTTPSGAVTRYAYDRLGRWIESVDPTGGTRRRELDLLGRPVRVLEADGNVCRLTHDAEGNVVRVQDTHRDVCFAYQGMGRLAARHEAGTSIRFRYDTEEQLTEIVNEQGRRYRIERGPTGWVDAEHGFDGITLRYTRDGAGRVLRVERAAGRATEYTYDPAGRVTAVRHGDGTFERYAYRRDGLLCEASNEAASIYLEHDALGRLLRERRGADWVESTYDAHAGRARVRSSRGLDLAIVREPRGDLSALHEAQSGFEAQVARDALGRELARTLAGGLLSQLDRDAWGRPSEQRITSDASQLRATGYAWEVGARLRQKTDSELGATLYQHDARGRLVSARYPDASTELRTADAAGNLFRSSHHDDAAYGPAGQLHVSRGPAGETQRGYDVLGNLVSKTAPSGASWRYTWNDAGMLAAVVRPDGSEVTFAYDALGRRIRKRYRGQTTHWVWDGDVPLHEWVEGTLTSLGDAGGVPWSADGAEARGREAELEALLAGSACTRGSERAPITWLFEPDRHAPLARLHAKSQLAIVCDFLGTPALMADAEGKHVWSAQLGLDGTPRALVGARGACPWRWPGQYEDPETALHYNRFRYFDPEARIYLSQDPIGLWGGLRAYAYVDDPLTWIDPLGLRACASGPAAAAPRQLAPPTLALQVALAPPVSPGGQPSTRAHQHARECGGSAIVEAHSAERIVSGASDGAPRSPHAATRTPAFAASARGRSS